MEMTEERLAQIHPIAIGLITMVSGELEDPTDVVITEELLFDLHFELAQLFGSEELRWALGSLIDFVNVLEHHGNIEAAQALMDGLESKEVLDAMSLLNAVRDEEEHAVVSAGKEKFRKLSDAKRFAEVPPEVAKSKVSIDALDFPRRI